MSLLVILVIPGRDSELWLVRTSFTSILTPSTPRSNNSLTRRCAANRSRSAVAWSWRAPTKPRRMESAPACRDLGQGCCAPSSSRCPATFPSIQGSATKCFQSATTTRRSSKRSRLTKRSSTCPAVAICLVVPGALGQDLRARVLTETGLPISVGVARTKFLANIASQVAKPDGIIVVPPDHELDFLHPLPVRLMWGVGPVTQAKLAEYGVETSETWPGFPKSTLAGRLGAGPPAICTPCRGTTIREECEVGFGLSRSARKADSVAVTSTNDFINRVLHDLSDRVGSRLRSKVRAGRTITVRIRFGDMTAITRSLTLRAPVASTEALYTASRMLVRNGLDDHPEHDQVSLLAVGVSGLSVGTALQLELPLDFDDVLRPGSEIGRKRHDLDKAIDGLRDRFGKAAVGTAATTLLNDHSSVAEEFRSLPRRVEQSKGRPDATLDTCRISER